MLISIIAHDLELNVTVTGGKKIMPGGKMVKENVMHSRINPLFLERECLHVK